MDYRIIEGDCIEGMRRLEGQSVNCVVTSPPYFGLRDYGHDGQIGLEASPDAYVSKLVEVFREVRRVLRDDGTVWLNLGDSYNGSGKAGNNPEYASRHTAFGKPMEAGYHGKPVRIKGLKPKDLIGVPWRVAFALQADGWYLRQDIIWHKPNPMPESVTDRCTKAHEYIFLLSKSPRYYFDSGAIKEPCVINPNWNYGSEKHRTRITERESDKIQYKKGQKGWSGMAPSGPGQYRNKRSVWTVATRPYKGAHFATFPPDLIRPCILAGCPKDGTVLDPFGGSGTTAQVALEEGRKAVLCELNTDYIALAHKRLEGLQLRIA